MILKLKWYWQLGSVHEIHDLKQEKPEMDDFERRKKIGSEKYIEKQNFKKIF